MMKIKEENLNRNILESIISLDKSFYNDKELTLNWYLERYKEYHKVILLCDDDKIVGYLLGVPIKKELYDAITNGVITNDIYVNPNMFVKESLYNYIVSIVIYEKYRNKGYANKLMNTLMNNLNGKYCTLTISKAGYVLASKYMDLKLIIDDNISVFVKE